MLANFGASFGFALNQSDLSTQSIRSVNLSQNVKDVLADTHDLQSAATATINYISQLAVTQNETRYCTITAGAETLDVVIVKVTVYDQAGQPLQNQDTIKQVLQNEANLILGAFYSNQQTMQSVTQLNTLNLTIVFQYSSDWHNFTNGETDITKITTVSRNSPGCLVQLVQNGVPIISIITRLDLEVSANQGTSGQTQTQTGQTQTGQTSGNQNVDQTGNQNSGSQPVGPILVPVAVPGNQNTETGSQNGGSTGGSTGGNFLIPSQTGDQNAQTGGFQTGGPIILVPIQTGVETGQTGTGGNQETSTAGQTGGNQQTGAGNQNGVIFNQTWWYYNQTWAYFYNESYTYSTSYSVNWTAVWNWTSTFSNSSTLSYAMLWSDFRFGSNQSSLNIRSVDLSDNTQSAFQNVHDFKSGIDATSSYIAKLAMAETETEYCTINLQEGQTVNAYIVQTIVYDHSGQPLHDQQVIKQTLQDEFSRFIGAFYLLNNTNDQAMVFNVLNQLNITVIIQSSSDYRNLTTQGGEPILPSPFSQQSGNNGNGDQVQKTYPGCSLQIEQNGVPMMSFVVRLDFESNQQPQPQGSPGVQVPPNNNGQQQ